MADAMADSPILTAMREVGGAERPKFAAAEAAADAAYARTMKMRRRTDWKPLVTAMCDEYKTESALLAALVEMKEKWIPECWLGEREAAWLLENTGKHGLTTEAEEKRTRWRKRVDKAAETLRDKCRAELEVRVGRVRADCVLLFCSTISLLFAGARGHGGGLADGCARGGGGSVQGGSAQCG